MKDKKEKSYWWIFLTGIVVFIIFIIVFIIAMRKDLNREDLLEEKVNEEISYLDNSIVSILNSMNNISLSNYILTSKEPTDNEQQKSKSANDEKSSEDTSEESSSESGGSNSSSEQGVQGENGDKEKSKENNVTFQMQKSGILSGKKVNLDSIENDVENLHPIWSTIQVDLSENNVDGKKNSEFNNTLDELTENTKSKDKKKIVNKANKLYTILVDIVKEYSTNEVLKDKYMLKENIVNSYNDVEEDNWDDAKKQIDYSKEKFESLKEKLDDSKRYNSTRVLNSINELYSAIDKKSKDIYYIKYKVLFEELKLI